MRSSSKYSALIAAALAMGLGMPPAMAQNNVQTGAKSTQAAARLTTQMIQRRTGWGMPPSTAYKARGPGWSHAQVKRMATKKRNQARNRRAHR